MKPYKAYLGISLRIFSSSVCYPFALFVLVSGMCCGLFVKANNPSLRDFSNLQTSFFEENSGRPYLQVGYKEVDMEKPKVGFLRLGLAFLKVHDLRIDLDASLTTKEVLLELFQKVSSKRGVRYAVAEPIELLIRGNDNSPYLITAAKGKFTSAGALRVWGDVLVVRGKKSNRINNLSLKADPITNDLVLSMDDGAKKISIPLKKETVDKSLIPETSKP